MLIGLVTSDHIKDKVRTSAGCEVIKIAYPIFAEQTGKVAESDRRCGFM